MEQTSEREDLALFREEARRAGQPLEVTIEITGRNLPIEVDTGAAVSVISDTTRTLLFPESSLLETTTKLTTYTLENR